MTPVAAPPVKLVQLHYTYEQHNSMQAKIPKVNSILGPVPYRGYVKNHDTLYTHDVNGTGTEGLTIRSLCPRERGFLAVCICGLCPTSHTSTCARNLPQRV